MSEPFGAAHVDQIRAIIDVFAALEWPQSAALVPRLVSALGWQETRPGTAESTLPVSWREVGFMSLGDDFRTVDFCVTDSVFEEDLTPEITAHLAAAFTRFAAGLTDLLGAPAGTRGGRNARSWWDLASGGRVALVKSPEAVAVELLSKSAADLERDEARLGISPA